MEKYEVKIFSTAKQDLLEIIDYLNTLLPPPQNKKGRIRDFQVLRMRPTHNTNN